jgi:DNA-binding response OmpR family regulator
LVTDVRLRDSLSGWELARRIRESKPALPIVYVTGSTSKELAVQGVPNSIHIQEPFTVAGLIAAVANLLNFGTPPQPRSGKEAPQTEPPDLNESRSVIEEYVDDLREIIKKLRQH